MRAEKHPYAPTVAQQGPEIKKESLKSFFQIVLVGDVGVGKTRLICSRGYRKNFSYDELPNVAHASSVWAIDQVFTKNC